jgi:superfamily II DNA or RNA helicase
MAVALRPYQELAVESFNRFVADGKQRAALILPTGAGKTLTALEIARRFGKRTLWLAHRQELIDQPFEALKDVWPGADVGIVKAGQNDKDAKDVVIASIQTVSRNRCARLLECGVFDFVVVDEVHHLLAPTFMDVIETAGCMVKGGPIMLGLTATPNRDGLKGLFNQVIFDYPMRRAIEEGYLCPLGETKQIRVPGLDFSKIRTTKGDFVQAALGDAMLSTHVAEFTARGVKNLAAGRRTIVFTVLVEQAELTSKWLNDLGIKSAVVCGETPTDERKAILDKFYDGEIDVVCNASVLTEGYDNPRVDCIVVARPTKSPILYRQMLGRGFRPHPDKQNLLVIDLVDASNRFDLMGAAKFGREIANQGRVPAKSNGKGDGKGNDSAYKGLFNVEEGKRQEDEADSKPLEFPTIAEAPKPPVAINWISAQQSHKRNGWFASTNEGVVCVFKAKISYETEWIVAVGGNRSRNQFHRLVGRFANDKFAFGAGADAVRKMAGGKVFATNLYPNWRAGAPTDEQARLLRSLGQQVPKTRGEAADSITVSLGVQYGREVATMMRDRAQGRPAPWLKDYQPLGAGR